MKTNLSSYEIVRHGIEYPDYFQGCGVSFTDFDEVQTGIGDTEREAFEDALEQTCCCHSLDDASLKRLEWDSNHIEWSETRCIDTVESSNETETCDIDAPYYHVSIRYCTQESSELVPA